MFTASICCQMHGKKQETNGLYVQYQGAFTPSKLLFCIASQTYHETRIPSPSVSPHCANLNLLVALRVSVSCYMQHEKGPSQQRAASLKNKAV